MPTDLTGNAAYRRTLMWSMCCGEPTPERNNKGEDVSVRALFVRWEEYQVAKQRLFQRGASGCLPLVTKALGQDVCQKYDALMNFYKRHRKDFHETIIMYQIYDNGDAGRRMMPLRQMVDGLILCLRAEDEDSLECLRDYLRDRDCNLVAETNIREIRNLTHKFPFHTDQEIAQARVDEVKRNYPKATSFKKTGCVYSKPKVVWNRQGSGATPQGTHNPNKIFQRNKNVKWENGRVKELSERNKAIRSDKNSSLSISQKSTERSEPYFVSVIRRRR